MQMPINTFKRSLAARKHQVGLFLGLGHAWSAELIATTGFDWLMIDGEHGPNDLSSIIAQLQALAPYPVDVAVRTRDHDPAAIKQLLDAGAYTLMVPMVDGAAQAEALVRAMRYPPMGIRGVGTGMARAARWNAIPNYLENADREACLIVQIESLAGRAAVDEIVAVPGVDAVFVGPSDLAAAMGYLGKPGHPEVQTAVEHLIHRIVAGGKPAGVFSADPALAVAYGKIGASFLLVGVDTLLLTNAAASLAARFRAASDRAITAY